MSLKLIRIKIHHIFRNSKKEVNLVSTTEKTTAVQSSRKIKIRTKKASSGSTVTISFLIIAVVFLIIFLGITYFRRQNRSRIPLQPSDEQNSRLLQLIKIEENP